MGWKREEEKGQSRNDKLSSVQWGAKIELPRRTLHSHAQQPLAKAWILDDLEAWAKSLLYIIILATYCGTVITGMLRCTKNWSPSSSSALLFTAIKRIAIASDKDGSCNSALQLTCAAKYSKEWIGTEILGCARADLGDNCRLFFIIFSDDLVIRISPLRLKYALRQINRSFPADHFLKRHRHRQQHWGIIAMNYLKRRRGDETAKEPSRRNWKKEYTLGCDK